jgi:hypothetical protein
MSAEEWFGLAIPVTVVTPDLFANSNGFTLKEQQIGAQYLLPNPTKIVFSLE